MEWLFVACVISLFIGLSMYGVLTRIFFPGALSAPMDQGHFAQAEEYPWGTAWVYDNDRERKSPLKPILFIHGLGGSIYSWRYQIKKFETNHPIIAMDLLGFGKSSKPESEPYGLDGHSQRILDILDAKNINSCYVVGCSLGGALALWLASQNTNRIEKALVISPAATPTVVPFPTLAYESLGGVGQKVISRPIIKLSLQRGLVHHKKITDEVIETYLAPFKDKGAMSSFFKTITAIKDIRNFESLSKITCPVLILRGQGDRTVGRSVTRKIKDSNALFQIEEHPVGGHHLMEDEPEWVNVKIQMFFGLKTTFLDSTEG